MKIIVIFNKALGFALVALLATTLSAASARADAPRPANTAGSVVMFRDGADPVQARRLPANEKSGEALSPISLQIRGRTVHASIGRRAILQLSAAANSTVVSFLRALRVEAISFKAGLTDAQLTAANTALSDSSAKTTVTAPRSLYPRLRLYLVESIDADEDGLALAARLSNVEGVESSIPDLYYERRLAEFKVPPNDPRYGGQWYLGHLQIERAWKVAVGDPDTNIVVIDDGCDTQHPDLAGAMLSGLDVLDDDDDPSYTPMLEGNEHGTACAGIIAAVGNNKVGISGVCPTCSLRCVRLFDRSHALIPVNSDLRAFSFAFDNNAAVVSNSWGFAEPVPVPAMMRAAIDDLLDNGRGGKGTLVVFAAGNENREIDDSEIGAIPGILNVGAVNNFDELAPFSNFGNSLNITAPTGTVTTDISGPDGLDPSDYTSLFGGTSSACPVVAGVAALVMSAVPDRSAREIGDTLLMTARPAPFAVPDANGHDPMYGQGIVDPAAALTALGIDVPAATSPAKDAGPSDADASEPDVSSSKSKDCGCSIPGGSQNAPTPLTAAALAGLCVGRTRRRRSHRSKHARDAKTATINPRYRP
jgi:serine protease